MLFALLVLIFVGAMVVVTAAEEPPAAAASDAAVPDASVTRVAVSGEAGSLRFAVTVESPDSGCDRYADWWEVVSEKGDLLYRRILTHSHKDEQPFTRSGGPVDAAIDERLIVRVHMHPSGYSESAMVGNVADGFEPIVLADFAPELEQAPPQPAGCRF